MKKKKITPPSTEQFILGQQWAATKGDPRLKYLAGLIQGAPLRVLDLCGDDHDNCLYLGLKPKAKFPVVVEHHGHVCAVALKDVLKADADVDRGTLPSGEALFISQPHSHPDLECIRTCDHKWIVFSTALKEVWLMLRCFRCGAHGSVNDPTAEEWGEAFYAPSNPYRWIDKSRVTIRGLARFRTELHFVKPDDE